jgi:hypothetical protein
VEVRRPGSAGLLDERPEDALVACERTRVRGRGGRAGGGAAHLEDRDADAVLGAARQRLAQVRAVAVGLEVEGDRADTRVGRELGHPRRGVERDRVAARDHRVQTQATARV